MIDADVTLNGTSILPGSGNLYGIIAYNSAAAKTSQMRQASPSEPMQRNGSSRSLDANNSLTLDHATITGNGAVDGIGVYAYSDGDNLDLTMTHSTVSGWDYGLYIGPDGGTIGAVTVTDNTLSNHYNVDDPVAGHVYNANCYSDHVVGHPGYPTQYDIPGAGGNVDLNPNAGGCADIDMVATSSFIGCPQTACANDTLYFRFDKAGYFSGQLILQLPAGLESYLVQNEEEMADVAPAYGPDRTANLQNTFARWLSGNRLELNPIWGALDPSVADGKYFAMVPVHNTSVLPHPVFTVTPLSYNFADASGEHTTGFLVGTVTMTADCEGPAVTLVGGSGDAPCNAYGNAASLVDELTYTVATGTLPNSPLDHAFIRVNSTDFPLSAYSGTWPASGLAGAVWAAMTEGCNTFSLYAYDTECNESIATVGSVIKDVTPPVVGSNPMTQPLCYNNDSLTTQYGAALIAADLNITAHVNDIGCVASAGTLQIQYGDSLYTAAGISLPVTGWPGAADAAAFWSWITTVIGPTAAGSYTFDIVATDCAGNVLTPKPTFTICVDFRKPDNSFTVFDARPTYCGVWLKWQWAYDADQADSAEIWRIAEPDYPLYSGNLSMNLANYEKNHALLAANGWTRVLIQSGATGTTSAAWDANPAHHHVDPSLGNYWKDVIGSDGDQQRSIYRYVTFVRDRAGNWSQVSSYALQDDADRSTNYWLGDFTGDTLSNPVPRGVVEGVDLGLLSTYYFKRTVAGGGIAPNYFDIGPENHENAYGKGIPNTLDHYINFSDLLPFSYNFGTAGNGGFIISTPLSRPFARLDQAPALQLQRIGDGELNAAQDFIVAISMTGNDQNDVKAAETQLMFDADVLELVQINGAALEVCDGLPFAVARAVDGQNNRIGIVVAAIGAGATVKGNPTLATVTFRWKSDQAVQTTLRLESSELADAFGNELTGQTSSLDVGTQGLIPNSFALFQNYPNPFNPTTQIRFDLAKDADVRLVIYNVMGQEVRTMVAASLPAGSHRIGWNGLDNNGLSVGSGIYVYRITAGGFVQSKKMLLTR
jgi:hypothetical protein